MQLTKEELSSVKALFQEFFADKDQLWLFGAAVNPAHKEGKVDLYIETQETDYDTVLRQKADFFSALEAALSNKKIDIFVKVNQDDMVDLPIYVVAKETGTQLV